MNETLDRATLECLFRAEHARGRDSVGALATVRRMDAAPEPTWTCSRRVARGPTGSRPSPPVSRDSERVYGRRSAGTSAASSRAARRIGPGTHRSGSLLALALALLAWTLQAPAHESTPSYDRVTLRVSAEASAENDVQVIRLYAEHQAERQRDASSRVNAAVRWALERAERVPAIESRTLAYRSSPVYRNQSLAGWRVRQALELESTDLEALGALAGELQERLAIESVRHQVGADARRAVEEALVEEAIARFRARAERVAGHFGRSGYRVVAVDVSTGDRAPGPVPMRAMAMADAGANAAPSLEAGTTTLTVVVSGTIELEL